MYSVLKLNWEEIICKDFINKRHTYRKVVELGGSALVGELYSVDSLAIINYDLFSGKPLFLVDRFPSDVEVDVEGMEVEGFVLSTEFSKEEGVCDIIATRRSLYEIIMEEE